MRYSQQYLIKMFRPAKIYHITGIVMEDKVTALINRLYEGGVCELKEAESDISSRYSYELIKSLDEMQTRFNFILDSLEEYKEVVQPGSRIKQLFSPEPPLKHKSRIYSTEDILEEVGYHLDLIEPKILKQLGRLQKIKEQIQKDEFIITNLSLLPEIETINLRPSENISVFTGLTPNSSLKKLKDELGEKCVIGIEPDGKTHSLVILFSMAEEAADVEKALHTVGFQITEIPYEDEKPAKIIKNLKEEIGILKDEKKKIGSFLTKTSKIYEKKFVLLSEEFEIAKQKIEALRKFKTTKAFSVVEAWVPKKNLEKFNGIVKEISKQYYLEADERDDAPTLLDNPKLVKPFEMITELYSPPKYREFDPTIIIAIAFPLFYGFMLTDAAYGLILILLGIVMYRGIGKYNEKSRKFATLLIYFGISTLLLGAVFGSYFGDFLQKLGLHVPMVMDPMKQVIPTLAVALSLGSLHIFTGLAVGFYENITHKRVKDAFAKQGVWIFFMIGLLSIILKQTIFGLIVIGAAVALQLVFNFIDGGFVISILSIFSFTGFVGDVFSYARLMALALSTAGIALAVNFMVFLVAGSVPYLGIILGIVIFIVGHLFNTAMNGLGAFIHATRLHFLEFFTKFYDGGGRLYQPFKAERKSTYLSK